MKSPNTSSQAVKLNPSCLGQAQPNRPRTSPGHKNTEPGSIFTVLRVLFMIYPFRSADVKSSKVVQIIPAGGTNGHLDFSFFLGEHLRTHVKDHTRYDQGPEIHGKPRRVLVSVGKAQLAGCLRVQAGSPLE